MRLVVTVLGAVAVVLAVHYCSAPEPTLADPIFREPAGKLAALDAGHLHIKPHHVAPYRAALDRLEPLCTENAHDLADVATVGAQQLSAKTGRKATALELLHAMHGAMPPGTPAMRCSDVAAALVALTTR